MTGQSAIPARIVIGVTGHRRLQNEALLALEVAAVLDKIESLLPPLKKTAVAFTALSPLAEGADRLVTRIILERSGCQLDVVLPMGKEDYAADFSLPESRAEFEDFLSRARTTRQLPPSPSRADAYAQAGRYVVDHCDILIAIWDGKPGSGRGGTSETISYARAMQRPFFWIHADAPAKTTFERGRGFSARAFGDLDVVNSERADKRRAGEKRGKR